MEWKLGSGEAVIDRLNSHIHRGVAPLLPEALSRIVSGGRSFINEEVVFDRIIGETICVATGPGDQIVYAIRSGRAGHTRFVRNRKPEACASMVVVLKKAEESDQYILITAFIGRKAELEPWDKGATEKSLAFWSSHALIWGGEPVVPGTETAECPWPTRDTVSNGRPLSELEIRVILPFSSVSQEMREKCVEIAREKSPSAAFDLASQLAFLSGFGQMEALGIAKATRWLAMIRRDHGMEKFDKVVGALTAVSTPKP